TFGGSGCTFAWNTPVICADGTASGTTITSSLDKEWVVCDRSAGLGYVYVAYARFSSVVAVECVTSANGGVTWAAPVTIQTGPVTFPSGFGGYPSGMHPAVDQSTGALHIVWEGSGASFSVSCDMSSAPWDAIYYTKSINNGTSFSPPSIV